LLKAVFTTSAGAAAAQLTYTHTFLAEVGSGASSSTMSVTSGTSSPDDVEPIMQVATTSSASQASTAFATFSEAYAGAGARWSQFSTDGRTVAGAVDGRGTEPSAVGSDVRVTKFKDGRPLAAFTAGAGGQAVAALVQQIKSQAGTCTPDAKAPAVLSRCTQCQLDCRAAYVPCSVAAVQSSLVHGGLAPSAYLSVANATCDSALQRCLQTCKSSGACCPDYCKGDAECCKSSWGCCPPSATADQSLSRAWPTCPRCGTPPWPTAQTSTPPAPAPKSRR
jgi:hypothetical protein